MLAAGAAMAEDYPIVISSGEVSGRRFSGSVSVGSSIYKVTGGANSVTFENCTFDGVSAGADGSCVYIDRDDEGDGCVIFRNCKFISCGNVDYDGGAIYIQDIDNVSQKVIFENCIAVGCEANEGGFLYCNDKDAVINGSGNTVILDCHAIYGGGGVYTEAVNTFDGFIFADNKSADDGGGMYNNNGTDGVSTISNCRFYRNVAGDSINKYAGGGLYVRDDNGYVKNCKFFENVAYKTGAELDSNTEINNCTFTSNFGTGDEAVDGSDRVSCSFISANSYNLNNKGSGTEANPYKIENVDDWDALCYSVKSGTTYENAFLTLSADIVVASSVGIYYETDSTKRKPFKGIFDGNGHTCTFYSCSLYDDLAAFAYAVNATVRNLTVGGYIKGYRKIGGIFGDSSGSTAENCVNNATFAIRSASYRGGIAGWAGDGSKFISCVNNGDIMGRNDVGGIVGLSGGGSKFLNCINRGSVSGTSNVGGIIGREEGAVTVLNVISYESVVNGSGIVGSANSGSTYRDCYYAKDHTSSTIGTGLTDKEFESFPIGHLVHDYEYRYFWAGDYTSCTAKQVCMTCSDGVFGHIGETWTVQSDGGVVTSKPTCWVSGGMDYTAVFESPLETQIKSKILPSNGHSWEPIDDETHRCSVCLEEKPHKGDGAGHCEDCGVELTYSVSVSWSEHFTSVKYKINDGSLITPEGPFTLNEVPNGTKFTFDVTCEAGYGYFGATELTVGTEDMTVSLTAVRTADLTGVAYCGEGGVDGGAVTAKSIYPHIGNIGGGNWYAISEDTTVETLTVNGTANLILVDGTTLTVDGGIRVTEGNTLNIFCQKEGTGKLVATGADGCAGIGGGRGADGWNNPPVKGFPGGTCGNVTIYGGVIRATGKGGGAGIGGGAGGCGGDVLPGEGGQDSLWPCRGGAGGAGGIVAIHGGRVTAEGGAGGAGIGGGCGGTGGNANDEEAAGFCSPADGGDGGAGGTVVICGGIVEAATGADGAAGIGGGKGGAGGIGYIGPTGWSPHPYGNPGKQGVGAILAVSGGVTESQNGIFTKSQDVSANMAVTGEFNEAAYIAIEYSADLTDVAYCGEGGVAGKVTTAKRIYPHIGNIGDGNWYAIDADTTVGTLTVNGTANLILVDGTTLTVNGGIRVTEGNTLNIYAQSAGTGKLVANGASGCAGIGGGRGADGHEDGESGNAGGTCGKVQICGGIVTANGFDGAAGIGGGSGGNCAPYYGSIGGKDGDYPRGEGGSGGIGGIVIVRGGIVTANGDGAGIGGGNGGLGGESYKSTIRPGSGGVGGAGGSVTINGGIVKATGRGAGIGGGCGGVGGMNQDSSNQNIGYRNGDGANGGAGGLVTINDGEVIAIGGNKSAGIGGGKGSDAKWSRAGFDPFSGETVFGSGTGGAGGTVMITAGVVMATGGSGAAGIGGGAGGHNDNGRGGDGGSGGFVTIDGGVVTANGGSASSVTEDGGVGIGGGAGGDGGGDGGDGGNGVPTVAELYGGGGTGGAGCTVTINGGIVTATGGGQSAGFGGGRGGDGGEWADGVNGVGATLTVSGGVTEAQNGIFVYGDPDVGENMEVTGKFNELAYIKIAETLICTGGDIAEVDGVWVVTPEENAKTVTILGLPWNATLVVPPSVAKVIGVNDGQIRVRDGNTDVTSEYLIHGGVISPFETFDDGRHYIESTASNGQYIDTKYVPTVNTRIVADFNSMERSAIWSVFFGVTKSDSAGDGVLLRYTKYDDMSLNAWFCGSSDQITGFDGKRFAAELKAGSLTLGTDDGTTTYEIPKNGTTPYNGPIYIFCGNNGGSVWRPQAMQLYSFQIYDTVDGKANQLVRDFVPFQTTDGTEIAGLYDRVTKKCFINAGSGSLTLGEDEEVTVPTCEGGDIAEEDGVWVVTPNGNVAAVRIENLPEGAKVAVKLNGYNVPSEAFVGFGEGGVFSLALNPEVVTPKIGELDAGEPFVVGEGEVAVTIKTIPGLKYSLIRGAELGKIDTTVVTTLATESQMTLKDGDPPADKAFYNVSVGK